MAKGFGKFLAGATIGAGLGMLFSPKKGEELRKDLKKAYDDMLIKVKDIDVDEVKESVENKIEEIKVSLTDLDKETVLKKAKEMSDAIVEKANDLVSYAKEKGTPIVEAAAEEARVKAVAVTKEVLKKLEKAKKD